MATQKWNGALPPLSSDEVHLAVKAAEKKRIDDITSRFHETVSAAGLAERSNFIDIEPHMMMSISEIARCYDFVGHGQSSRG